MKKSQTKRALVMSVLSMLLCFTMLVGTTFAWFTDSVTSTNNRIVSGTLKVDLEVLEEGVYTSVRDMEEPIFDYALWEPGYTEVKTLKIQNEGTLALKYQLNVIPENVDCILSDVIEVYMCFGESTAQSAADLAGNSWWYCGTLTEMMANPAGFTQGKLLPVGTNYTGPQLGENGVAVGEITATVALHMKEEAGNEYQGLDLGRIDVVLMATQFTYEEDSFGSDYDANATYPVLVSSADEANEALAQGGNVALTTDLTTDSNIVMNGGALNGNGKTLTASYSGTGVNAGVYTAGGAISNLNIANGDVNAAKGLRAIYISGAITADTIVENCVIDATYTINTSLSSDVPYGLYVNNSTLNGWTSYDHIEEAVFTNCEFGEGSTGYANLRPYIDTTLTDCEFSEGFTITRHTTYTDFTITLNNCTVNSVAVTADNFMTLLAGAVDDNYSLHGTTITVIVDGVTVAK